MRENLNTENERLTTASALSPADFLLEPSAFVQRCHQVFPSNNLLPGSLESQAIISSLQDGLSKLDVVDAFRFLHNRTLPSPLTSDFFEASRTESRPLNGDELATFAKDDDRVFVDLIFSYFSPIGLGEFDKLKAYADLKGGAISRKSLINWVSSHSSKKSVNWSDDTDHMAAPVVMAGPIPQSVEIAIDARLWQQAPSACGLSGFILDPGWVLISPKYKLKPGPWLLELTLWQPQGGRVNIDIVTNSGLDRILDVELSGPATLTFCFEVKPADRLTEVRLYKPDQPEEFMRLSLGKLAIKPAPLGPA